MTINDLSTFQYSGLNEEDIFICAFGYESRSYYLFSSIIETRNKDNTLIICFDDFDKTRLPLELLNYLESSQIRLVSSAYSKGELFQEEVLSFLNDVLLDKDDKKVYIDYSSMPRNWYCNLPHRIEDSFENKYFELIFLYVAGVYPETYETFPTAGIESIRLFYGGALPKIDAQRTHLIALSYDTIRTQSLLSMLEPEYLVVCYAYDTTEKKQEIEEVNRDIIRRASASVALPINNFVSIVQKMNEIILEQTCNGQIVIIPDGPKPLIFSMSLSTRLVSVNEGVTCLHINRNERIKDNKVDVSAKEGEIYGVKIVINKIQTDEN